MPAVTAVVVDGERILLQHRVDNDLWAMPGGALEIGETPAAAAVREAFEETGIEIRVLGLVGIYSDPGHLIAYDDGEVRQQFSICFRAEPIGGELKAQQSEAKRVEWVAATDLSRLRMHPAQRIRIDDGLRWTVGGPAHFT